MCPKDADGMANSVDPNQTAPRGGAVLSGFTLFVCSDLFVRKFRTITACFLCVNEQ